MISLTSRSADAFQQVVLLEVALRQDILPGECVMTARTPTFIDCAELSPSLRFENQDHADV